MGQNQTISLTDLAEKLNGWQVKISNPSRPPGGCPIFISILANSDSQTFFHYCWQFPYPDTGHISCFYYRCPEFNLFWKDHPFCRRQQPTKSRIKSGDIRINTKTRVKANCLSLFKNKSAFFLLFKFLFSDYSSGGNNSGSRGTDNITRNSCPVAGDKKTVNGSFQIFVNFWPDRKKLYFRRIK